MKINNTKALLKRTSIAMLLATTLVAGCSEKSMEEHLASARTYVTQQQLDAAVVEYKNAIQKAPSAAEPRFELGKVYLQNKNFAAAEKELNKAMELGYSAGKVIPLLSAAYQQSGAQNALADVDYRADGMTAVEMAEVGFYKLQALMQLDQQEEAEALIAELASLDTSSVYKGLIESYEFVIKNDAEQALVATEALRKQAPSNKDVLQQLAKLYLQTNQPASAAEVYGEYVPLYPEDLATRFAYAALLVELRELDTAEPVVDDLLAINETHPLLNAFKGIIESAQNNYAQALSHLEIAVQNGASDSVVRMVAGFSAYQIQDFEAAQRHLTMIASDLPDNHPGLRMLADSMLQLGENDEALAVLNRVEGEQTTDAALFSKASYQLLKEGNVVGAKQMVEKSEAVSTTADDLSRLGALQLSMNDLDGLVNLEDAVKKAPQSASSQNTLVRAYVSTNQLEKAKEAALEWHKQSPDTGLPLVYLGSIATSEKAFNDAAKYFDEAATKGDVANEVTYARTNLLIAQDKKDNATAFIRAFIDKNPADVQALTMWFALAAESGSAQQVITHTKAQLDADEDNINLRLILARMFTLAGNGTSKDKENGVASALALLSEVKGDADTPLAFWNLKGQVLITSNKANEAEAFFDRWLLFYPHDKSAVLGKLLILDAQKQFAKGLTLTNAILEKRNDAQLTLLKAYFHSRVGQTKPAWDILNATSPEVRALPFVRGILARLYLSERNAKEALPHAQAAYDATPNSDNALLVVAANEIQGNSDGSFAFLKAHVANKPNDIQSNMLLAERQIQQDRSAAIATYERVLKATPDNFVVLNNLAYLAFEDKNFSRAEELAQRAVELQSDNADAADTLAQIYIAQGKQERALALYEKVSAQPIANDEVYLNHVALLLSMEKTALAKRKLESRTFTREASKSRVADLKKQYGI